MRNQRFVCVLVAMAMRKRQDITMDDVDALLSIDSRDIPEHLYEPELQDLKFDKRQI